MTPKREEHRLARSAGGWEQGPFNVLQRFADEVDRMFEGFGFGGRPSLAPFWRSAGEGMWAPEIEVSQTGDQLVIKADLPGMSRNDLTIDVTDDALTIRGERKSEHKEEEEGYYRSERRYGSFYRVIALPEGAITEQAKANFRDGVLEITMPAPPTSSKSRRLEIAEGSRK